MMKLPDPEHTSEQLLTRAGVVRPPVELNLITSLWAGLNISEDALDKAGYLVDLGKQGGEIIVRISDSAPRRNFTIAHEIGHWLLLREYGLELSETKRLNYRALVERWCDHFASALLMPKDWVLSDLRQARISGLLSAILTLPNAYNVSPEAFRIRVTKISPTSLYVATEHEGKISFDHTYQTKELSHLLLAKALHNTRNILSEKVTTGRFLDPDSNLLCIYRTIFRNWKMRKWLICILPSTMKAAADLTTASTRTGFSADASKPAG